MGKYGSLAEALQAACEKQGKAAGEVKELNLDGTCRAPAVEVCPFAQSSSAATLGEQLSGCRRRAFDQDGAALAHGLALPAFTPAVAVCITAQRWSASVRSRPSVRCTCPPGRIPGGLAQLPSAAASHVMCLLQRLIVAAHARCCGCVLQGLDAFTYL